MITVARTLLAALVVTMALAAPSAAQVGMEGGSGLFLVDSARTLGHQSFAVSGFYVSENLTFQRADITQTSAYISATAGFGDTFEVSALLPYSSREAKGQETQSGMADGLLKAKWNFASSEQYNLKLAAVLSLSLAMGDQDKQLGTGKSELAGKLALDKEYEDIAWHFNVGYASHSKDEASGSVLRREYDPEVTYGAGLEWFVHENVSVIGEVAGRAWTQQIPRRDDNTLASAGARYYLGDWGSLSAGYGSYASGDGMGSSNYRWFAGLTVGLGLGRPKLAGTDGEGAKMLAGAADGEGAAGAGAAAGESGVGAEGMAAGTGEVAGGGEDAGATVTITLEAVYFKFDSATLTKEAEAILERNGQKLADNPSARAIIEGHTCWLGPDGYNQKLGQRRARAAKLYLVKKLGLNPDRFFVISYGEDRPAQPNDTKEGRAKNRRAEFNTGAK